MQRYIHRVAVLGSGVMGSAIAAQIAGAGISVTLLDMVPAELTEQETKKGLTLESPAVRNRFAQSGKDQVLNPRSRTIYDKSLGDLITVGNFTDNMNLLADADWIIEVVVERLDIKRDLFRKVNQFRKPGAIVSSNTSGISINTMIEEMPQEFREHFIGAHFFNPPRYMELVELIPSKDCKKDCKQEIRNFMKSFVERTLGKTVVLCKDTPAFIANRIGAYVTTTAMQMLEKSGYNVAEFDEIAGPVIGRPGMAVFRLQDTVGLDITSMVSQNLRGTLDDHDEKRALTIPEFHNDLVARGHLGNKAGQGYYKRVKGPGGVTTYMWDVGKQDYVEITKRPLPAAERASKCKTLQEKVSTMLYAEEEDGKLAWEHVKNVLLFTARRAGEISYDYADIDNAMRCGYNWLYGPFELWDAIGLEKSVARMKAEGDEIPDWIEQKIACGDTTFLKEDAGTPYIDLNRQTFEVVRENSDAALYNIGDDILLVKCKTKSNAIDLGVSELLLEAAQTVEQGYAGLVVANGGRNFSVGANLSSPTGFVKDMDFGCVEKSVETLQQANMALKYCKRPVVAAPFGSTLGGGAEIVLHTSAAVAAAETYMGLVEVGVGLIPAGGGITELLMRFMQYAEKAPKASIADFVSAAWEYIAMGKVTGSAHEAMRWGFLRPSDNILLGQQYIVEEAKRMALSLSAAGYRPPVKHGIKVTGANGRAALEYTSFNMFKGGFVSEYDAYLAGKVAYVITGGDATPGSVVPEEHLLRLEKEVFMELIQQEKTRQRIEHMLKTGKRLSN